jgi:hypothetical protein
MIRKLATLSVLLFTLAGTAQANSQTFTFDSNGSGFFQANNWETYYIDSNHPDYEYSGLKSMADLLSVEWAAINSHLYSDAFFSTSGWESPYAGEIFDLNNLWLASGYGSQTVVITAFDANGDIMIFNGVDAVTEIVLTTQAQRYEFDWKGISYFIINTAIYDNFVRDPRVQFSQSEAWVLGGVAITVVPEPETYAMLLAGLGVVGALARRRRARAAM